jgi:hypothetical protein
VFLDEKTFYSFTKICITKVRRKWIIAKYLSLLMSHLRTVQNIPTMLSLLDLIVILTIYQILDGSRGIGFVLDL